MRQVWIIEGWFGDIEWIEGVYATEEAADAKVRELWKTRIPENPRVPIWVHKVAKFSAEPWDLND